MALLARKAREFWRVFMGAHPAVYANDGAMTLFGWAVALTAVISLFSVFAAADQSFFRDGALPLAVMAYLCVDGLYAAYSAVYYPQKVRLAETLTNTSGIFRIGEHIAAAFIVFEGVLLPLTVTFWPNVPIVGPFVRIPGWGVIAATTTAGFLASSSIVKMIRAPSSRRATHNKILLSLCFFLSISCAVLLLNEALGRGETPPELFWLYLALLVGYMAHNVALSLLCPECEQRRWGHLVGFLFGIAIFVMIFLYGVSVLPKFPVTGLQYLYATATVFFAGAAARYLFKRAATEHLERQRRNGINGANGHHENNGR